MSDTQQSLATLSRNFVDQQSFLTDIALHVAQLLKGRETKLLLETTFVSLDDILCNNVFSWPWPYSSLDVLFTKSHKYLGNCSPCSACNSCRITACICKV